MTKGELKHTSSSSGSGSSEHHKNAGEEVKRKTRRTKSDFSTALAPLVVLLFSYLAYRSILNPFYFLAEPYKTTFEMFAFILIVSTFIGYTWSINYIEKVARQKEEAAEEAIRNPPAVSGSSSVGHHQSEHHHETTTSEGPD
jgi:uncharacterized protein YqhQ